jgi:hypothetical protein
VVGAYISYVRIREAHNLAGVARIGENFLISGETGVKNDFAAMAGFRARRAAVKNSPVLEREDRATFGVLRQCVLQRSSFRSRIHG